MTKPRGSIWLTGGALLCSWFGANAQTPLSPDAALSQGAGCFSIRCFLYLQSFEDDTAITVNTGSGVAVHSPSAPVWTIQQVITNPDYARPPNYRTDQQFGPAAYKGSALLIGGTSPKYNGKEVVYVYSRTSDSWSYVQTLALQRPADYERTNILRIATDGTTAIVAGVRVKQFAEDAPFVQVDLYRRNASGTFSRRGGFKPPIAPMNAWAAAIEVSGDVILVSDPYAESESGRVYVYGYDSVHGWRYRSTIAADAPQPGAHFGQQIAIDGNTIVVSAPDEVDPRPEFNGAVYIYQGAGKTWPLQQKLTAIVDPKIAGYQFGHDIDLSGDRLVVGKYINDYSDSMPTLGLLYEKRTTWMPVAEFTEPESRIFSGNISISGDTAILTGSDWAYSTPAFVYELPELGSLPALAE